MDSKTNNPGKLTGAAIIALRATIKALEMNAGQQRSTGQYRYEISKPTGPNQAVTARIYEVATGADVEGYNKPLEEWAKLGKKVRLAFVGLKDAKIALEERPEQDTEVAYVRFTLNSISGSATLSKNGNLVEGKPTTIDEWAKIGREVEKPLFESLKMAQEYGSENGIRETRAKMIARGIIRAPRETGTESHDAE